MIKITTSRTSRKINLRRGISGMEKRTAEKARERALLLTSGTVSSATLAEMGHPFGRNPAKGRRKGSMRGNLPRLPINRQTGALQKSLRIIPTPSGWRLQFTAPHSPFILAPGGTRKMVARGFWSALRSYMAPSLRRELKNLYRS